MTGTAAKVLSAAAVGGIIVAAGVAPATAATPTGSTTTGGTTKTAGCSSGSLPTAVLGDPGVKAGATEGAYLFHDAKGYEVRVTHPGASKIVFGGTLYAAKGFKKLDSVRLEKGDLLKESANGKQIDFRFTNYGHIDGFHAYADCSAAVKVTFRINGKTAGTSQVFLGKAKATPTSVPFTVDRTKPATALTATKA